MKCFYPMCPVTPETGGTLFRINAKGQPGVWACRKHVKNTDAKIDPAVEQVVSVLEKSQVGKK